MSKVLSVNVGLPQEISWHGRRVRTAIWKRPVPGRVKVRGVNLEGDGQADLGGHGGVYRAVMVYQEESYRYWEERFGKLEYGGFGENLTVTGLADDEVSIGDRIRIGEAVFEVTAPRVTCYRLGIRLNYMEAPALLVAHRRPGFYLRIIEEGTVGAGDEISIISRDPEKLTVAETSALLYLKDHPREELERALRIPALSPGWQESFKSLLEAEADGKTPSGNAGLAIVRPLAWQGFRELKVVSVTRESDDVKSVELGTPEGSTLPTFLPGQHLVVRIKAGANGSTLSRNYSLCGIPGSQTFRIGIKREPMGIVSTYVHEHIKPGDTVEASAPRGEFILATGTEPVALISAGIGITPMLAMLHAIGEPDVANPRPVWWIHAARDNNHDAFAGETRQLLNRMRNATSCVIYSRPIATDKLGVTHDREGHISLSVLDDIHVPKAANFYLCGPTSFMNELSAELKSWGVDDSRVHMELFGAGQSLTPGVANATAREPHAPEGVPGAGPKVSFVKSGLVACWSDRFQNLLEFAEACDVPVRWSCRTGVCHTCESGLVEGQVNYSPEPLDRAAPGRLLICCSTPEGDVELDL